MPPDLAELRRRLRLDETHLGCLKCPTGSPPRRVVTSTNMGLAVCHKLDCGHETFR